MLQITNQSPMRDVEAQCKMWRDAGSVRFARADVKAIRNERTHEIEVLGLFCIAPDEHTSYLYPIRISRWGYWNKTQLRKQIAEVKKELLSAMAREGYSLKLLTEPLKVHEIRF
jgi:hypothetical protein